MKYKIGQILTSNQDVEVEKTLSGEKVVIPKGNKIIIGADKLAHHLRTGMIQPLGTDEVEGYDSEGLAEYLLLVLKTHFPIDEMLEDYEISERMLLDKIEYAFDDIGF